MKDVLKIDDDIKLAVVHRLRKRNDRRPRTIVAKFARRKDRETVLNVVRTGRLNGSNFAVNEQFPEIIGKRRQALLPKLHEERRKQNRAHIRYDKLFINGEMWNPPATPLPPQKAQNDLRQIRR